MVDDKQLYQNGGAINPVVSVIDNLTSTDATKPLSAKQGKELNDKKLNIFGEVVPGQPCRVPYYFEVLYNADKATVKDYTIRLDNTLTKETFSMDIKAMDGTNAGLYTKALSDAKMNIGSEMAVGELKTISGDRTATQWKITTPRRKLDNSGTTDNATFTIEAMDPTNNLAGLYTKAMADAKANDSVVVHKSGDETVGGKKKFSKDVTIAFQDGNYALQMMGSVPSGTIPSADAKINTVSVRDSTDSKDMFGMYHKTYNGSGKVEFGAVLKDYTGANAKYLCFFNDNGNGYVTIPNRTYDATNTMDAVNIGMLEAKVGNYVGIANDEEITGTKTFTKTITSKSSDANGKNFIARNNNPIGTKPTSPTSCGYFIRPADSDTGIGYLSHTIDTDGNGKTSVGSRDYNAGNNASLIIYAMTDGNNYATVPARTYDATNTMDIVNIGMMTPLLTKTKLNGTETQTPEFYAPTTVGLAGQFYGTDGTTPGWKSISSALNFRGSCTKAELLTKPATIGDVWSVTDEEYTNYAGNGTTWDNIGKSIDLSPYQTKAVGTADRVLISGSDGNIAVSSITTTALGYLDATSSIQTQLNNRVVKNANITAGTKCKITYDAKGLVKSGADLTASDIPTLEISKINGLQDAIDGKVAKNTSITAGTKCKITYDAKGLVTAGADLTSTDIPTLAISKISGLQSALDGKIAKNSDITGATKCKISYDVRGLVTAGADLEASDIPTIEISKINGLQDALDGKVAKNTAITPGEACKIYYDAKGLVTGGDALTVDDLPMLPSNKINAMTGYAIATTAQALTPLMTFNEAMGYIEYRLKQLEDANIPRYGEVPFITVTAPTEGQSFATSDISVSGTVNTDATSVTATVNGGTPVALTIASGGAFSGTISLAMGANEIVFTNSFVTKKVNVTRTA